MESLFERYMTPLFFGFIGISTCWDIYTDLSEKVTVGHQFMEVSIAAVAFFGLYYFLRKNAAISRALALESQKSADANEAATLWREKNEKLIRGFADAIEEQLKQWKLTPAESDIALFLLKGFSTVEIAGLRGSSEKTVKQQCTSIYSKSGLTGRSELSAFFLEEVLGPK